MECSYQVQSPCLQSGKSRHQRPRFHEVVNWAVLRVLNRKYELHPRTIPAKQPATLFWKAGRQMEHHRFPLILTQADAGTVHDVALYPG